MSDDDYKDFVKISLFDDWKKNGERYMQELESLQSELISLEQSEAPDRERIEELQLSIMQQESHINDMNEVADQEQREAFYQSEYGMSAREYDLSQQAAKIEQSIEQTPDIDHDYTPER